MDEAKIEPYYQNEAKYFVDVLFDTKLFRSDITRDGIKGVEDLLAYYLQSHSKTANKISKWSVSLEKVGIKI